MARGATGTTKCGFCMTGDHKDCRPAIKYYDKVWYCTCEQCHPETEKRETKDEEMVEEPIQEQEDQGSREETEADS